MHRPTLSSNAFVALAFTLGMALFGTNAASAQQITLVSSASDGTAGNNSSSDPSISTDGQFVAFVSDATNLVPGDTNGVADIFVKDRVSSAITRVSVTTSGEQATHASGSPRISGNGRFVVFSTFATLAAEDTNPCPTGLPNTCSDVYVHDRQTGTTTLASVSSAEAVGNDSSFVVDISADGRFVLFLSTVASFVDNDTNGLWDLFLRDLQNGTTIRVSVDPGGNQLTNYSNVWGRMSADARFIVYSFILDGNNVVYLHERETGAVSLLSKAFPARSLPIGAVTSSYIPTFISDDGRIVMVSEHTGLPQVSPPSLQRLLVHDRVTGHTNAGSWGIMSTFTLSAITALSGDGRIYAIGGVSTRQLSLADRGTGLSERVHTNSFNTSYEAALSGDGRFTAFSFQGQVSAYDRDSGDGDGMPSAWETQFGLNPTNLTDAAADADLDGVANLQEYLRGTHPTAVASATRYFAEGAANAFFTTRMAAVNPGDDEAVVVFRFLGSSGHTTSFTFPIAARSRTTLELPANGLAPGNDFSTVIESNRTVVVDRTMTWDSTGYGAHTETALLAPSTTWHLAEGATHGAFDLFYLIQNPNGSQAHVTITYLRQAPFTPITRNYVVEPNSRRTIAVDTEGADLAAVDTAASFQSDLPIVVERAMYSTRAGQPPFVAGHGAAGVTAPALRWFLAEGATGNFFDLYVLVGNPNTTESMLKVTYLLPSGQPFEKEYTVGPQQRLTIYPEQEDARLANTPVSVIVESTNNQPVVVERAMWWPKGEWYEAHVSAGATTTGTKWALAEGEVSVGGDTYILIANTSTTAGTATVTLLEELGTPRSILVELPPSSRVNVPVSQYLLPAGAVRRRFGALIETNGVEIVVERAIYTTIGGVTWSAGTAALGTKLQ